LELLWPNITRHRIAARLRFCLKPKLTVGRLAVRLGVEVVGKPLKLEFLHEKVLYFQGADFAKASFSTASLGSEIQKAQYAMDIISTINHSLTIASRLREIAKNISESEFRNLLADLANELADTKLQVASLKEQIAKLTEENQTPKSSTVESKEKPSIKWGCYQFEDDPGLYCTACYDTKKKKILTTRMNANYRSCPVCKSTFGA
jgi:hypothetical protein